MFSWPLPTSLLLHGRIAARVISSSFGPRTNPVSGEQQNHGAIDIPVDVGTPISAIGSGVVDYIGDNHPTAGNYVQIDHGNGYWSRYLHLSQMNVRAGQKVAMGQVIGLSGGQPGAYGSGRTTAPHLHLDVWRGKPFAGGVAVDPLPLLTREVAGTAAKIALVAGGVSAAIAALAFAWVFRDRLRAKVATIKEDVAAKVTALRANPRPKKRKGARRKKR
jgi:murein DD-endopeptidase MepM/ murein hydrolase activator NlpD